MKVIRIRQLKIKRNEAKVIDTLRAGGIQHRNIVSVYCHGPLDERQYYIDMELCLLSLYEYIHYDLRTCFGLSSYWSTRHPDSTMSCLSLWGITDQVVSGLEFIHAQGYIHRDLKPQNSGSFTFVLRLTLVLLSLGNAVWKIADFGLTTEGTGSRGYPTRGGGSPGYKSPELLQHEFVTMKSDIWALGVILHELACGASPFKSEFSIFKNEKLNVKLVPDLADESLKRCIPQMINTFLEIEWWKRPTAREIRGALACLSDSGTNSLRGVRVYKVKVDGRKPVSIQYLFPGSNEWKFVEWKQYWYSSVIRVLTGIEADDVRILSRSKKGATMANFHPSSSASVK
jgi:serine/threonine protein kinase